MNPAISGGGQRRVGDPTDAGSSTRWVCPCHQPAILLATYDRDGRVHIKARDRYWHVIGRVEAVCPRCGAVHRLESSAVASDAVPN